QRKVTGGGIDDDGPRPLIAVIRHNGAAEFRSDLLEIGGRQAIGIIGLLVGECRWGKSHRSGGGHEKATAREGFGHRAVIGTKSGEACAISANRGRNVPRLAMTAIGETAAISRAPESL